MKDEANLSAAEDGQLLILEGEDFLAVHLDAAAGRAVQSAEHMQQGGFAGAGGSDDGNELSFSTEKLTPSSAWTSFSPEP